MRTLRTIVDVPVGIALFIIAAVLMCSWWLLGPRRKQEKVTDGR